MNDVPENLVTPDGQVAHGIFPASVLRINGRDFDYRTPMGRRASPVARHFHYKQFQYFGVVSDRLLVGCALADTAFLGIAFLYVFEPHTGRLREFTWRSPLARSLSLSDSPVSGESRFRQGRVDIRMGYREHPGGLEKTLSVRLPDLELDVAMNEPRDFRPMSISTRTGKSGWVYANKVAGRPVSGQLREHGRKLDLSTLQAGGHHDFSAGYMRRETFWNWACLSGRADGHWLGLNLSCGVNETGFTENCIWLDNELIPVGLTRFDYDRNDLMQPWSVTSGDGAVALDFQPEGRHRERLNLGLFASNFHQIFGRFSGSIRVPGGASLEVRDLYGFVEEQYAKW